MVVVSAHYIQMLETFLTPQLQCFPVNENTSFQQDGATSHSDRVSMNFLNDLSPNCLISRNGDVQWPPRSPDLSSCDYFLWGYFKLKSSETHRATIKVSPLQAMKAHRGCGHKGPHIHSNGTRMRQDGQSYVRPPLPRGNSPVLILQEVEWTPGPVWTRRSEDKSPPLRHPELNPGRPARSQAPCCLSHLAHTIRVQHI